MGGTQPAVVEWWVVTVEVELGGHSQGSRRHSVVGTVTSVLDGLSQNLVSLAIKMHAIAPSIKSHPRVHGIVGNSNAQYVAYVNAIATIA